MFFKFFIEVLSTVSEYSKVGLIVQDNVNDKIINQASAFGGMCIPYCEVSFILSTPNGHNISATAVVS